jgi:hypothetical protein
MESAHFVDNQLIKIHKDDKKMSGWSLHQKYILHEVLWNERTNWEGDTSEELVDETTEWGVRLAQVI